MTEADLISLGIEDWRKRIAQLRIELRNPSARPQLDIPAEGNRYGTELRPQGNRHSRTPSVSTPEIASASLP